MSHRIWTIAVLVCALWLPAPGAAQQTYSAFEQITVGATAIGLTAAVIAPSTSQQAGWAICRLETAQVRYTTNGTTPTSTVGTLLEIGEQVQFFGQDVLARFRAIRTGGTSGQLDCTVSTSASVDLGAGSSGGGGAGDFDIATFNAAFGTAGTADTQVLSVQGIASMTPILATVSDGAGALNVICDSGCAGGTQFADDADFVDGTSIGTAAMAVAESAAPSAVTEGDAGWLAMTLNRALKVSLYAADGTALTADTQGTHATTLGTITSVTGGVLMGNASTATPTDVGADGDAAAIWLTRTGAVNIADAGGSVTVDGTVTVTDGAGALNTIIDSGTVSTVTTLSQLGGVALPIEDAGETAAGVGIYAMGVRRDTIASSAGTSGDNTMASYDSLGRLWTRQGNPCADHARVLDVKIDTATSGNVELVALNGSDIFYVCGYNIVSTAAQSVQLISGTGTACATGETDETGPYAFAANGGIAIPNTGAVQFTTAAGAALCIELSAASQVSGIVSYVRTAAP